MSPGEYLKFFGEFCKQGKAVVHLSFCSKLSSTHRNAKIASARLGDVYVLDTDNLGGGIALPALKGCKMRDSGASAEEIYTELEKLRGKVRVSYLLDNISFLRAGGRCSAAAAFGSGLLSIRPCAVMIDGKIEVIKKYRGKSKAVRLQYASEQLEKYKNIDADMKKRVVQVMALANNISKLFDMATPTRRNELLQLLISNCQLNGSKLEYTINAPFNWLINSNNYTEWTTIVIEHLDDFECVKV